MHSRKSLGPRMLPWGITAVTGYSCEDFPYKTTWSCLLLRKEEIRQNIWPACQKSSATARVAPDLLKALAILSDTTVRGSAVDQGDLKPLKIKTKATFL